MCVCVFNLDMCLCALFALLCDGAWLFYCVSFAVFVCGCDYMCGFV